MSPKFMFPWFSIWVCSVHSVQLYFIRKESDAKFSKNSLPAQLGLSDDSVHGGAHSADPSQLFRMCTCKRFILMLISYWNLLSLKLSLIAVNYINWSSNSALIIYTLLWLQDMHDYLGGGEWGLLKAFMYCTSYYGVMELKQIPSFRWKMAPNE